MNPFKKFLSGTLLIVPISLYGQFSIPSVNVGFKPGVTTAFFQSYITADLRFEGDVLINQFLSAGVFYSRSAWGIVDDRQLDEDTDAKQLAYGLRVQGSTGRISKFRPYAFLTLTKLESVEEVTPALNFAGDWLGVTFGGGVMVRLSNRVYLNIIEFEYLPMGGKFFFIDSDRNFIALRLGTNVIIGKNR